MLLEENFRIKNAFFDDLLKRSNHLDYVPHRVYNKKIGYSADAGVNGQ